MARRFALRLDSPRQTPSLLCGVADGRQEASPSEVLTMPLRKGKGRDAISRNIGKLIGEGYPRDQAAAIAHDYSRRSNKGKKK